MKMRQRKQFRYGKTAILKIHSLHSRDFSRELGGWTLLRLRKLFYALMTKKCYPQKRLSKTCVILMAS